MVGILAIKRKSKFVDFFRFLLSVWALLWAELWFPAAARPCALPKGTFTLAQCVAASRPAARSVHGSALQSPLPVSRICGWRASLAAGPQLCVSSVSHTKLSNQSPAAFCQGLSCCMDGISLSLQQWPVKRCPFPHFSMALPRDCLSWLHGVLGVQSEMPLERPFLWPVPFVCIHHASAYQPPARRGGTDLLRALALQWYVAPCMFEVLI